MKKKIETVIFLILVALVFIFTITKLNHMWTIGSLTANINNQQVIENNIKVGDLVYFDPINYNVCIDNTEDNCHRWVAISKDNNIYELYYLDSDPSMTWTIQNPTDIIKNTTNSWSDKLSVSSDYDITISDDYNYKFSEAKSRMLTRQDYDNNYDIQNLLKLSCYSGQCAMLDTENQIVMIITASATINTFTFENNKSGATLESAQVRPVIKVDMSEVTHSQSYDNKVYNVGDLVYFDPISEDECNEDTFDLTKVKDGTSTCYKWRVITAGDNALNKKADLQLDHNYYPQVIWARGYTTDNGPTGALQALASATNSWNRVNPLNYRYNTYDVMSYEEGRGYYQSKTGYGTLNCLGGLCNTTSNAAIITGGVRGRLITVEEITEIVKTVNPSAVWTYKLNDLYYVTHSRYAAGTTFSIENIRTCENDDCTQLKWLIENTAKNDVTGSTDNEYVDDPNALLSLGYWTLTPIEDLSLGVVGISNAGWIHEEPSVDRGGTVGSYHGIRPVISVNKNLISSKVTVTYNDEERITTKKINSGSNAELIDSQGKENYEFKYWSLEQNGSEYNFNTIVNDDITLYAVYEINKFDVEFYDDEQLIRTIKVDYNNTISSESIPVVEKEGYTFKYWENENDEFDFTTKINKNYKLYSKYEKTEIPQQECTLSIESNKYNVDNSNLTISNVPEKETNEEIDKNLIIKSDSYKIVDDKVIITCKDETKEYKINRTWIPQTGQIVINYLSIIGYISIIIVLLIVVNKQRSINKRLRM